MQNLLKVVLAPNLQENSIFWHSRLFFDSVSTGHLGNKEELVTASLCWSARKRAELEYEGLWTWLTLPSPWEISVWAQEKTIQAFSSVAKTIPCEAVACAIVEALLGSKERSWHAAFWYGTDNYAAQCGLRSRQSLCPELPTWHLCLCGQKKQH